MKNPLPTYLQGEGLRTHLFAAAIGAIVIMAIGFNWTGYGFGWTMGSTAKQMANTSAQEAVTAELAPICAARFLRDASVEDRARFAQDKSWNRNDIISKNVKFSGQASMDSQLKDACAAKIDEAAKLTAAQTKS